MDALTVIFTGLMIFDGHGYVHLVKAGHHKMEVYVNANRYDIKKSIGFQGLTPVDVSSTVGFELPDLKDIFGPRPLSIDTRPTKVIRFRLLGGTTSPFERYALCTVNQKTMLFWQGLQWKVTVPANAKLVIDGTPIDIDNKTTIRLSNDYTGADDPSHVSMYEDALHESGELTMHGISCDQPYPKLDSRAEADKKSKNNPITCPPVSLR